MKWTRNFNFNNVSCGRWIQHSFVRLALHPHGFYYKLCVRDPWIHRVDSVAANSSAKNTQLKEVERNGRSERRKKAATPKYILLIIIIISPRMWWQVSTLHIKCTRWRWSFEAHILTHWRILRSHLHSQLHKTKLLVHDVLDDTQRGRELFKM